MDFVSTRGKSPAVRLSEALLAGLAPDGGLYVPVGFPEFSVADFVGVETVPEIGARLLAPFFAGDGLEAELAAICGEALDFEIPLKDLDEDTAILELFHGPTAAFKDVGARFLASCLSRLGAGEERPLTILVATSGDTGGAVAAAFYGKPNIEVQVLYPKGKVSARQEHQLTCWGGNVRAFAVDGVFDDCQRMVKAAFADGWWQANKRLSSANSINIGRVLPQMIYYAAAALWSFRRHGVAADFVIPTGNLGNALACMWARRVGLPIGNIHLAANANRPIVDFVNGADWEATASVQTLASAMDVGNPSNLERVRALYPVDADLRAAMTAASVEDKTIEDVIRAGVGRYGEVFCPHTAVAVHVREGLRGGGIIGSGTVSETGAGPVNTGILARNCIVVATAHPAKFESIVEPLIGRAVEVPPALEALFGRPTASVQIAPTLEALTAEQ